MALRVKAFIGWRKGTRPRAIWYRVGKNSNPNPQSLALELQVFLNLRWEQDYSEALPSSLARLRRSAKVGSTLMDDAESSSKNLPRSPKSRLMRRNLETFAHPVQNDPSPHPSLRVRCCLCDGGLWRVRGRRRLRLCCLLIKAI